VARYVALPLEEIVGLGASSPIVARRLLAALGDLVAVAPEHRRAPLEAQRERLLACAHDPGVTVLPEVQGLGSGRELTATP
jgi:hypothetical protein